MAIATGEAISSADVLALTPTFAVEVSDTLRNSNDTERSSGSASWVKLKETKLNANIAQLRIKFDLNNTGGSAHARIYKNGSPIGTERENNTGSYVTYSEDFTGGFATNDLIQIYGYIASGTTVWVRNLRFYYTYYATKLAEDESTEHTLSSPLATDTDPTISMTNQDP